MVRRAESDLGAALAWPVAPGELAVLLCALAVDLERLHAPDRAEADYVRAIARLGLALGSSPGPVMDVLVAASTVPTSASAFQRELIAAVPPVLPVPPVPPVPSLPQRSRRPGRHRVARLLTPGRATSVAVAAVATGLALLVVVGVRSSSGGVPSSVPPAVPSAASSRPSPSVATTQQRARAAVIDGARSELSRMWQAQLSWLAARGLMPAPRHLRIVALSIVDSSSGAVRGPMTRCVVESLSGYRIVDRDGRPIARVPVQRRVISFVAKEGRWQAVGATKIRRPFNRGPDRCGR